MVHFCLRWTLVFCGLSLLTLLGVRLVDLPQGDPLRGQKLYGNNLYCAACHINIDGFSPQMKGLADWVASMQITAADETVEQYLAESILYPNQMVVPGYRADLMPQYHLCPIDCQGLSVTLRDLQDLVAYLRTL
jgi:hypothetical protein